MARKNMKDDDEKPDAPEATPPPANDPDAAIRRGGPGDPPAEDAAEDKPDQPTRARVKIGKKEFEVDPDLASAVEDRERDYMRGIQMDRRERDELDRYRRAATPTPSKDAEPDFNTLLFENPTKALELRDQRIEARLEAKYRTEQSTERMWGKFYRDHPDLADENVLVSARFSQIFDEIADLPTSKAMDILADDVRKDILRISRKAKGSGTTITPPTGRAVVEGATGDRSPQPTRSDSDDESKSQSLSDEIRARNRKRREAKSA